MKALLLAPLLAPLVLLPVPLAAPEPAAPGDVTVEVAPTTTQVTLGEATAIHVRVTDVGSRPTPALVVHLDVTDPQQPGSVDPEDWTATLTRRVGILQPGETARLDWPLQPITPGDFTVYAVVLGQPGGILPASNTARVSVADQRVLDPGGILPVAIAEPVLVALLLLARIRPGLRRRRRPRPAGTSTA